MWEVNHKDGWAPKNWCFQIPVLEKTLESPLDSKIKPVNPIGNQPWIFIARTDVEAVAPILWPPGVKRWLIGKDPDAGKDRKQKGKGVDRRCDSREHHQLKGHESEHTPGANGGQGSLASFSPWGHKESDLTVTDNKSYEDTVLYFLLKILKFYSRCLYFNLARSVCVCGKVGILFYLFP